jgi:hypothetical protein
MLTLEKERRIPRIEGVIIDTRERARRRKETISLKSSNISIYTDSLVIERFKSLKA